MTEPGHELEEYGSDDIDVEPIETAGVAAPDAVPAVPLAPPDPAAAGPSVYEAPMVPDTVNRSFAARRRRPRKFTTGPFNYLYECVYYCGLFPGKDGLSRHMQAHHGGDSGTAAYLRDRLADLRAEIQQVEEQIEDELDG